MTKLSSDLLQTTTFISNSLSFVLIARWKVARMTYFLKAEPQVYLVSFWTVKYIGE